MAVFVLDKEGKPLMPCSEKRARQLLERGRARVHKLTPFAIRLVDRLVENSILQDRWRTSATRNRVSRRDREGIRGNGNGSVGGEDGANGRDSELDAGPGRRRMSADWSAGRRQESGCEGDGRHGGNSSHRLRSGAMQNASVGSSGERLRSA